MQTSLLKMKSTPKQLKRKVAAAEKKAAKKAAKEVSDRKKSFKKNRKKIDNGLGKEFRYYFKESKKAIFKHPFAETADNYKKDAKKCCSKCDKLKILHVFRKNDCGGGNIIRSDGLRNRRPDCRVCCDKDMEGKRKAQALAKELGIAYKAPPKEPCRTCGCLATKGNPLVFDHHHELNVFRGYCCNNCNKGMGLLKDTVASLCGYVKYMNETEKLSKEQIINMIFN